MNEKLYFATIAKFGVDAQLDKAIEEMSELTKEICKSKCGQENVKHLAEEMADVEIMIEQLKLIFDCEDEVEDWRQSKLDRLAGKVLI